MIMNAIIRKTLTFAVFIMTTVVNAYADYSSHGRPWDADDNYDSSRGLWFLLLLIGGGIIFVICIIARNIWEKHQSDIKEGFKIIAFFGVLILLFFYGKSCSESSSNSNSGHSKSSSSMQSSYPSTQQPSSHSYQPSYTPPAKQLKLRTEYEEVRCDDCGGFGKVTCPYCNGKGLMDVTCEICHGVGSRQVYKVVRSELDPSTWQEINKEYGYENEMCMNCLGSGKKTEFCKHCNSDASLFGQTWITCSKCSGHGKTTIAKQVPYYE